jgi:electron transfer flavoprotein alpha subunit
MPCAVSARQRFKDMARYMLSNLSFDNPSFDDYLRAGGWRGYAQKAAKNAFVTEARSWLEPLQKMLDSEQARLLALENTTTADDFLLVVAIKRQLGTLNRYLKISSDDQRHYQTMQVRTVRARQKNKTKRIRRSRRRI